MWNSIVLLIFSLCTSHLSNAADLVVYKESLDKFISAPLTNPLPKLNSTFIDPTLTCVIYTFGFDGKVDGPATTTMLLAYLATKKRNVFLVNWQKEAASSGLLGRPLSYALSASPNAKKIGYQLGDAIGTLYKAGLCRNFHLIGHSLGAHLMGYAGRRSRVNRITGLDPARALHEGTFATFSGLDWKCASMVDILHTDSGSDGYGTSTSVGTVDIWPNGGKDQPGCPIGDFPMFSQQDLCSHDRSWQLYAESIAAPASFPAAAAEDYKAWRTARSVTDTIYMGELTSISARGDYYMTTNAQSPFARGQEGLLADTNESRKRRHSTALTRLLKYLR